MNKLEQLEKAYKKENSRIVVRILAVLMVLKGEKNLEYTAPLYKLGVYANGLIVLKWNLKIDFHLILLNQQ